MPNSVADPGHFATDPDPVLLFSSLTFKAQQKIFCLQNFLLIIF